MVRTLQIELKIVDKNIFFSFLIYFLVSKE